MECEQVDVLFQKREDGEISLEEQSSLEAHLKICERCQKEDKFWKEFQRLWKERREIAPFPCFSAKIEQEIEEDADIVLKNLSAFIQTDKEVSQKASIDILPSFNESVEVGRKENIQPDETTQQESEIIEYRPSEKALASVIQFPLFYYCKSKDRVKAARNKDEEKKQREWILSDLCISRIQIEGFDNYRIYTTTSYFDGAYIVFFKKLGITSKLDDLVLSSQYIHLSNDRVKFISTLSWAYWLPDWDCYKDLVQQGELPICFTVEKETEEQKEQSQNKSLQGLDEIDERLRECTHISQERQRKKSPTMPNWDRIVTVFREIKEIDIDQVEAESKFLEILWYIDQLISPPHKLMVREYAKEILNLRHIPLPPPIQEKLRKESRIN